LKTFLRRRSMPGKIRKRPAVPEYIIRRADDVPLTFLNDAREQVQEQFSIEFRSRTEYGFVKLGEALEKKGTFVGDLHIECEVMARTVTAIIDSEGNALTDETGAPADLSAAFFLGLLDAD